MNPTQVTVTVENLSPENGTTIAATWFALHDGSFDSFDEGSAASTGIEALAEDGITGAEPQSLVDTAIELAGGLGTLNLDEAPLPEELLAGIFASSEAAENGGVQDVAFLQENPGAQPSGETVSTTLTLDVDPTNNRFFSFAAMLIPSNDAFIGNDNAIDLFDDEGNFVGADFIVTGDDVWDAGSEVNDEDPFNAPLAINLFEGVEENGVVQRHPGFLPPGEGGFVDIDNSDGALPFRNDNFVNSDFTQNSPVARITVTANDNSSNFSQGDILIASQEGGRLVGGDEDDLFVVQRDSNNLVTGNAGADIFLISNNTSTNSDDSTSEIDFDDSISDTSNTISDFAIGEDTIIIKGSYGVGSASDLELSQVDSDTIVSFAGNDVATLLNIEASNLQVDQDFVFL